VPVSLARGVQGARHRGARVMPCGSLAHATQLIDGGHCAFEKVVDAVGNFRGTFGYQDTGAFR
jgi:hypothetical protein